MDFLSKYILFCIFYIKLVQNAPFPSKPTRYQIDEFIDQLMTSEKFSELADDIAERAVLKLKSVDLHNATTLRQHSDSIKPANKNIVIEKQQYARVEPRYKENTNEEINIYKMPEENKKHERKSDFKTKKNKIKQSDDDYNPRLSKTDKTSEEKFGKIDTKTFLKHDDSSQELYLNFKHITKELHVGRDTKSQRTPKHASQSSGILSDRDDDIDDFSSKSKEKTKRESKEGDNYKDMKIKINNENDRAGSQHSDEKGRQINTSKTIKKKKLSPDNVEDSDFKISKKLSQINDDNSDSLDIENNDTAINGDFMENSDENQNNTPKEIIEVGINRAHSDFEVNVHRSDENSKIENSQNNHEIKKPIEPNTDPIQVYSREKGKLFAYVSSPDYNEYHENLARLHNSNVFINTY